MTMPTNDVEALTLALHLAITAPTEDKARQAAKMAEKLAAGLSEIEVERAKREAMLKAEP